MITTHAQSRFRIPYPFLIFPALLIVAHGCIALAIVSFGMRAKGYPIAPIALGIYAVAIFVGFSYFLVAVFFPHKTNLPRHSTNRLLSAIVIPAFLSLVLAASLWMTAWLDGGRYAPWDVGDADVVMFYNLALLFLIIMLGIVYRSRTLLNIGLAIQLGIYLMTYSLPNWIRYPDAGVATGLFGTRPSIIFLVLGSYIVAMSILHQRKHPLSLPVEWQFAVITNNLVAGGMAYMLLTWFPQNGMLLGWRSETTIVPLDGWNWLYVLAEFLVKAGMVAPILFFVGKKLADMVKQNKRPFSHKFLPYFTIGYLISIGILALLIHRATPAPVDAQEISGVGIGHWESETGIAFLSGRHLECELVDNIPPFTTSCQIEIAGEMLEIHAQTGESLNFPLSGTCEAFYGNQQWPYKIGSRHVHVHWFAYIEPALGLSNAEMNALRRHYFFENLPEAPFLLGTLLVAGITALLVTANFITWFWTRIKNKWVLLITAVCCVAPIIFYAMLFIGVMITGDFWD